MKRWLISALAVIFIVIPTFLMGQEYHTIYEIQQVAAGDDSSYMVGDTITTSGIVTAGAGLFYAGSHISFYLQDNSGGPWSGILIFNEDNSAFATLIGDSVLINGWVSEYNTFAGRESNMTEIVTIGEVVILLPNRPLPEIMVITPGDIDSSNGADSLAEQYEGCLVQVQNVWISDVSSPYSQFKVTDGEGECIIRTYSDSLQGYSNPPPPLGTPYESITGVIYHVYGNYTIMPRTVSDLVLASGPPIISGTYRDPGGHPWSTDTVNVYCNISDDGGIEETFVYYRVDGGNWYDLILEPQGELLYKAMVPPQPNYSTVDYYIYAMDDEELVSYDPPGAPDEYYSYSVSDSIPSTIYEVQFTEDSSGASFFQYRDVQLTGVVTADSSDFPVDTTAGYQIVYIQDTNDPYSTGGSWNGIYIYNTENNAMWLDVQRGDLIAISATVNEYYGMTELVNITDFTVMSSGNPLPVPVEITCADLMEGTTTGEQYEGCLVQLNDIIVIDPAVTSTLWSVTDASGEECIIGTNGDYSYEPSAGDHISYLIGLVRFSSGTFKLEPRNDADFGAVAVENVGSLAPLDFDLKANYPNPFNPVTNIEFTLKYDTEIKLEIFDILGRKVKTLVNGQMSAGRHTVQWEGDDASGSSASSGIYFIRYSGEGFNFCQKMVLIK